MSTSTDDRSGRQLGGREAADGDGAPARPRARAPLADELPRAALRRRDLGAARSAGVRRLRRPDARTRASRCCSSTTCSRRRSRTPRRATGCSRAGSGPRRSRSMFAEPLTEWMTEMPADELATRLTGGVTAPELPDEIGKLVAPCDAADRSSCCRRCRTSSSCATRAPGSTAASRSTTCSGRRASTRR